MKPLISITNDVIAVHTVREDNDGLLYCPVCQQKKQTRLIWNGSPVVVSCMCRCEEEAYEAEQKAFRERERMNQIRSLKASGLQDPMLRDYTFEHDYSTDPVMCKAHKYVDRWNDCYENNIGLLLFGPVGTGKTFFAGCIANALLDQCVPVLMTNFSKIINTLSGMYSEDKNAYIESLNSYDLLIIDDLGIERSTEYVLEQMYSIIDARYRSRKPMIITTNLGLNDVRNAAATDVRYARIYDRILEMCQPISFTGKNYRFEKARANMEIARQILL